MLRVQGSVSTGALLPFLANPHSNIDANIDTNTHTHKGTNTDAKKGTNTNIATGETSQAITPFHFFDKR